MQFPIQGISFWEREYVSSTMRILVKDAFLANKKRALCTLALRSPKIIGDMKSLAKIALNKI